MYNDLLDTLSEIEGWFSPDIFFNCGISDEDKQTILQILLHEYAEQGLLKAKLIDGDWCFIHPDTLTRLVREHEIDNLLKEDLDLSIGTVPLPEVTSLGMIDATKLNLSQLTQKLNYEDERKTKKWLEEHNIPLRKDGREKVVYEFSVDFALQLEIVEDLMQTYPNNWFEIYAAISESEKMTNAVFKHTDPNTMKKVEMNLRTRRKFLK